MADDIYVNQEFAFEYLCTLAETRDRWSGVVRDLLDDIRHICRAERHSAVPPERPHDRSPQAATKRKRTAPGRSE
jgi:hypothetical protein